MTESMVTNGTTECVLLVDDDQNLTEGLSLTLAREGRTIVVCSDIDAAEIALATFPVTHLVSDVQLSGPFSFEGLHFIHRARALSPNCRVVLMTGYASDELRRTAISEGAAKVLAKPFNTSELEGALASHLTSGDSSASESATTSWNDEPIVIPTIDQILMSDMLAIAFQPILRLQPGGSAVPFGFEALTRVRGRWAPGGPAMLFDYAHRRARSADVNISTLLHGLASAAKLPEESIVFLNVDPLTFESERLMEVLVTAAASASIGLDRIVLELTERSGFVDRGLAVAVFKELRKMGVRFALDDHGSAYSHLSLMDQIQPSFIKISSVFGSAFEEDLTRGRVVHHTLSLARDFGCETVLEGVETAATALAAQELGIELVQGYHFGRPQLIEDCKN